MIYSKPNPRKIIEHRLEVERNTLEVKLFYLSAELVNQALRLSNYLSKMIILSGIEGDDKMVQYYQKLFDGIGEQNLTPQMVLTSDRIEAVNDQLSKLED